MHGFKPDSRAGPHRHQEITDPRLKNHAGLPVPGPRLALKTQARPSGSASIASMSFTIAVE